MRLVGTELPTNHCRSKEILAIRNIIQSKVWLHFSTSRLLHQLKIIYLQLQQPKQQQRLQLRLRGTKYQGYFLEVKRKLILIQISQ